MLTLGMNNLTVLSVMNYGLFDTLMFCVVAQNDLKLSGKNEFLDFLIAASNLSQGLCVLDVTEE